MCIHLNMKQASVYTTRLYRGHLSMATNDPRWSIKCGICSNALDKAQLEIPSHIGKGAWRGVGSTIITQVSIFVL